MSGGIHDGMRGGTVRVLVDGAAQGELLHADTGLSFWGGVDPATGRVIDRHHPCTADAWRAVCWPFPRAGDRARAAA